MKARFLVIAEFDLNPDNEDCAAEAALDALNSYVACVKHNLSIGDDLKLIYASRDALEEFAEAGLLLPNPGILMEET